MFHLIWVQNLLFYHMIFNDFILLIACIIIIIIDRLFCRYAEWT